MLMLGAALSLFSLTVPAEPIRIIMRLQPPFMQCSRLLLLRESLRQSWAMLTLIMLLCELIPHRVCG